MLILSKTFKSNFKLKLHLHYQNMSKFFHSLSALTFLFLLNDAAAIGCRDGWIAYKNEKCFKTFERLEDSSLHEKFTFDEAVDFCKEQYPEDISSMISLKTKEEYLFFYNYTYHYSVYWKSWLSARHNGIDFRWEDDSPLTWPSYAIDWGWQFQYPVDGPNTCLLISGARTTNINCSQKNFVSCQYIQTNSVAYIHKLLMNTQDTLERAQQEIKNLQESQIPRNFVYVQLPGQSSPKSIWPAYEWREITEQYAGTFFRAAGGKAAPFGTVQNESSWRIEKIETTPISGPVKNEASIPLSGPSDFIQTGFAYLNSTSMGLRLSQSQEEVRPQNMAVRIWTRLY